MKLTFRFRLGRMPMPPIMTSNLPVSSAGMMPDHLVGTNSTLTPMSSARRVATSISKPISLPVLSFMAQGTKVDMPTRSTPRWITCSTTLSWLSAAIAPGMPAREKTSTARKNIRVIRVTIFIQPLLSLIKMIFSITPNLLNLSGPAVFPWPGWPVTRTGSKSGRWPRW